MAVRAIYILFEIPLYFDSPCTWTTCTRPTRTRPRRGWPRTRCASSELFRRWGTLCKLSSPPTRKTMFDGLILYSCHNRYCKIEYPHYDATALTMQYNRSYLRHKLWDHNKEREVLLTSAVQVVVVLPGPLGLQTLLTDGHDDWCCWTGPGSGRLMVKYFPIRDQ